MNATVARLSAGSRIRSRGMVPLRKHSSLRQVPVVRFRRARGAPEGPRHGSEPCLSALKVPNDATREAIRELEQGRGIRSDSLDDLFRDLGL